MADLQAATATLLSWFLYVGIALSAGAVIASFVFFTHGNRTTARKLFLSGLAGLLLGASANQIYNALMAGVSLASPADFVCSAIVACLIVCSVLYFGFGRKEEGTNYAIAAALAAGFIALIPAIQALFNAGTITLAGTCVLDASASPVNPTAGDPVNFEVSMPYGSGSYTLYANFGDGTTATATMSPGKTVSIDHTYSKPGTYTAMFSAKGNGSCYYALGVYVGEPPSPWFLGPFDLSGFFSGVNSLLKVPLNLFYWAPEFNLDNSSEDMKLYLAVTSVALTALGLFLAIRIVSGFIERDPSASVVDSIKEAVLVLAVILLAPYLYQTFAVLCNQVSSVVVDRINLAGTFATLVSLVVSSLVLGVISSFAGTLGAVLTYSFVLSAFAAALRYALIKGIVYCIPLLAVAYLFPAARGAVKFFMNILAGLVLAGPVAAFVLAGLSNIGGAAGPIASAVAPALAYFAFPIFLSMASGASPTAAAHGVARLASGALAGFRGPSTIVAPQAAARQTGGSGGGGGAGVGGGAGGAGSTGVVGGTTTISGGFDGFVVPQDYRERYGQGVDRGAYTVMGVPPASGTSPPSRPSTPSAPVTQGASGGLPTPAQPAATQGGTGVHEPSVAQEIEQEFEEFDIGAFTEEAAGAEGEAAEAAAGESTGGGRLPVVGRVQELYKRVEDWYAQSVFKQKIFPRWMKVAEKFGGWGGYGHHAVLGSVHPYSYKRMRDETRAYRQSFMTARGFQTLTMDQARTQGVSELEDEIDKLTSGGPF